MFPSPLDPPDPDFSDECITITIPAGRRLHEISTFFNISDDDIDEDEQSFALVAEILDVPDNKERQNALEYVEPLKLESLTMIVSCLHFSQIKF